MATSTLDAMHAPETALVATGKTPPRSWVCEVASGENAGTRVAIGSRPVVLGTDPSCDVVLKGPTVSRRHAEFMLCQDGIKVVDLGSTNGTFFQSSRIREMVLCHDAVLQVGQARVRIAAVLPPNVAPSQRTRFGGLVGQAHSIRQVFAVLELASRSDATVLIEGESGTGKELAARALHDHSPRADKPFVVVDCSATHEQLIDSQLYGHVRGAFTGAVSARKGSFQEANGGTLFLDEIGELPLASQAKLLRAIEAKTVQPLGSDQTVSVDTRVVAATHQDLQRMVEERLFRFDLYQRLSVIFVRIPPLRERTEDLPALVRHFYEGRGVDPGPIEGANVEQLQQHPWPGNVRELRNMLERAWVLSGKQDTPFTELSLWLNPAHHISATPQVDTSLPFKEAKELWNQEFERRYLAAVFNECGQSYVRTAERTGINRNHVKRLLLKYHLVKADED